MTQLILKWIVVLAALFAVGPLAGSMTATLRLADGGPAASLLTDGSMLHGLAAGGLVLGMACVMGILAGRLVTRDMGLTVAGLILAWAAWRLGVVDRALSRAGSGGMLKTLAIEGLLVGLVGTGIAMAIGATSREKMPRAAILGASFEDQGPEARLSPVHFVIAGAAGAVAGGVVVWVVAVEALKGQCVIAGVVGGVACAVAAQLCATMWRVRLGVLVPMLAMAGLACVAPIVTKFVHGSDLAAAAMEGRIFPIGKLGPMDWLAGALLGVPVGLAWANSMLEREPEGAAA